MPIRGGSWNPKSLAETGYQIKSESMKGIMYIPCLCDAWRGSQTFKSLKLRRESPEGRPWILEVLRGKAPQRKGPFLIGLRELIDQKFSPLWAQMLDYSFSFLESLEDAPEPPSQPADLLLSFSVQYPKRKRGYPVNATAINTLNLASNINIVPQCVQH